MAKSHYPRGEFGDAYKRTYGHHIDRAGNVVGRISTPATPRGMVSGSVRIHIDDKEIGELADFLNQAARLAPQAVARALNRTVSETRTAMSRALVKQTGLPYGTVRRALSTSPASPGNLSAEIIARGGFTPLAAFKARQTAKGVSAAPWNTRRIFAGTFIIKRYGGNVYKRAGKARFPLHKLYGPAIPRELPRDQSRDAFDTTAPAVLAKRLSHELGRLLTR